MLCYQNHSLFAFIFSFINTGFVNSFLLHEEIVKLLSDFNDFQKGMFREYWLGDCYIDFEFG